MVTEPESLVAPYWNLREDMTTDLSNVKPEGWVSLRQFLKIADISYPTGLLWIRLGQIQAKRRGGVWAIYASEIKRFLEEGTLPPDPEEYKKHLEEQRTKRERKQQRADGAANANVNEVP